MINLIRNNTILVKGRPEHTPSVYWSVSYYEGKPNLETHANLTSQSFKTIEQASEFMNSLGVGNDDIDNALIDMYSLGHIRAIFKDAKFDSSQDY